MIYRQVEFIILFVFSHIRKSIKKQFNFFYNKNTNRFCVHSFFSRNYDKFSRRKSKKRRRKIEKFHTHVFVIYKKEKNDEKLNYA